MKRAWLKLQAVLSISKKSTKAVQMQSHRVDYGIQIMTYNKNCHYHLCRQPIPLQNHAQCFEKNNQILLIGHLIHRSQYSFYIRFFEFLSSIYFWGSMISFEIFFLKIKTENIELVIQTDCTAYYLRKKYREIFSNTYRKQLFIFKGAK